MDNELAALWHVAARRPLHGAACGCGMHGAMAVGPREIELDILDYIEYRHQLQALPDWLDARRQREATPTVSFPAWFAELSAAPALHSLPWPQLLADAAQVLRGIADHARGRDRLAPAASLARGWLSG